MYLRAVVAVAVATTTIGVALPARAVDRTCAGSRATKIGTTGDDTILGTSRRDVIVAGAGDDRIFGRGGNDVICGGAGDDRIDGGRGQDLIEGNGGRDSITGGGGRDQASGGQGDDSITGGGGFDALDGGAGDDALDGGRGVDEVDYGTAPTPVNVDLATGMATGMGADSLADVEWISGSRFDDVLVGDERNNFFLPDEGDDDVRGGGGNDMVLYFSASQGVDVDLARGTATGEGTDTLDSFEAVYGSFADDTLTGDSADNLLIGRMGNDTIDGAGGDDWLAGGDGEDVIDGGPGDYDVLDFNLSGGEFALADVVADLEAGTATGTEFSYSLQRVEGLFGTFSADVFRGDEQANFFFGGEGDDELTGRGGDDALEGGLGGDIVDGGEGTDQCGDDTTDNVTACEGLGVPPDHPLRTDADVAGKLRTERRNI